MNSEVLFAKYSREKMGHRCEPYHLLDFRVELKLELELELELEFELEMELQLGLGLVA
jgi:hypothetical protein